MANRKFWLRSWHSIFPLVRVNLKCAFKVLSKNHFEKAMTSSLRKNILLAVQEVQGLNVEEAESFLRSDELIASVKASYRDNVHLHKIKSIPLFIFNLPQCGIEGGPFRTPAVPSRRPPWIKQGSNTPEAFLISFESIYATWKKSNVLSS